MSNDKPIVEPIFLTHGELANWFTRGDIEDIYSVLEKVRTGLVDMQLTDAE